MADKDSRSGFRYVNEDILDFVNRLHAGHDRALEEAFHPPDELEIPAIQLGPSEARLLHLLLRMAGAKKVVEIGTLAGYSAIWLARALPPDGRLWTIEHSPAHAKIALRNLEAAGMADKVTLLEGEALSLLGGLEGEGPFDAVFVDADKGNYDRYGRWAAKTLRPGGLLLADNAFFFGRLLEDSEEAAAVRRLHEEAAGAFDGVCIGTGDGMFLGIRRPS